MAKILIAGLMRQYVAGISPAITSFTNGYFSFGTTDAGYAAPVQYNRTISISTNTESTRTAMSTAARATQGASGFSSTHIYHIKGYSAGLITTVNKVLAASDSQSSPTISFTVERRGPYIPCPFYLGRIYVFGGYRDTDTSYRAETTYINSSTDTATNSTNIPVATHVGTSLFNNSYAWLMGGYIVGSINVGTIFKFTFATSSVSTLAATDVANMQGYGLNNRSFGYRAMGSAASYNNNKKLTYATDTLSAGTNSPEAVQMYQGTQYVTSSTGYCWTGYRASTLNRILHKLTFATETWANASYTTGDTNTGWVQATGGF